MIKVIVFDCDGVMFDSKPVNKMFYNHLLNHFNKSEMTAEELEYVHTHNVALCIEHIFRHYPDIDVAEVDSFRKSLDYTRFLPYFRMEDDLIEFLEIVKEEYFLAISTARSDTMELLLDTFGLTKYYGKVMTSANAAKPKPAADGMLEILDHYGCTPDEAVFIGDSIVDYHHAQASGVRLIAFNNNKLKTDMHVNKFMQIFELNILNGD